MNNPDNRKPDSFECKLSRLSLWLGLVFYSSALILLLFLFFDMRKLSDPACIEQLRIKNNLYLFSQVIPDTLMSLGTGFLIYPLIVFSDRRKKQKERPAPDNADGEPHE